METKQNGGCQGLGDMEMVSYYLMTLEFQFCKVKRVLEMDSQYECTEYYLTTAFKKWVRRQILCVVYDH